MEAWQHVKLSHTNRSLDLPLLLPYSDHNIYSTTPLSLDGLVIMAAVPTPDPIPNSVVKPARANGTVS